MTTAIPFSALVALLVAYALLLSVMLGAAVVRGVVWRRRVRRSDAILPEIRDALVDYVSGSNDLSRLRGFAARSRADLSRAMLSFRAALGGTALDRLCALSVEFGLIQDWVDQTRSRDPLRRRAAFAQLAFVSVFEPCRRAMGDILLHAVNDADPEVSLAAARALLHADDADQVQCVFGMALSSNLLVRVLLAEDLRRHTVSLSELAVPEALRSDDPRHVCAALEMLVAWQRTIPLKDMGDLLDHCDKGIRLRAIRLAPLVPLSNVNRASIITALEDTDPELRLAAAVAVGRLHMVEALPALARSLRLGSARVARAAAASLAEMPPLGWQTLAELSARPHEVTAKAAREALARLRRRTNA